MILDIKLWIEKSKLYLIFLISVILWGILGPSKKPWCNWQDASIILTLILTIIVYVQGFWGEKRFKSVAAKELGEIGLFFIIIFSVIVMTAGLLLNTAHEYYPKIIKIKLPIWAIMLLFLIISIVLSYIDFQVGKNDDISMMKLFYYSDLPIIATILILFIYSIIINGCEEMEPFFSGAIAFQMIISILLASLFKDDNILKIKTT